MRRSTLALATAVSLLGAPAARAQSVLDDLYDERLLPTQTAHPSPAPQLRFTLVTEIPLPGPLAGQAPRWIDGQIEIRLVQGLALVPPDAGAIPTVTPADSAEPSPAPAEEAWVVDPRGVFRFRSIPSGAIVAEGRCERCRAGWKSRWKLRVPGKTLAPPLVDQDRVYFGALDNNVYCVRAKSGHRIWVAEAAGRLLHPLVSWHGAPGGTSAALRVILVVPDPGSEILALDAEGGDKVARVEFAPESGQLVGSPAVTPDGRIVAAFDTYAASEASLLVYRLELPGANGEEPGMDYNAPLAAERDTPP